MEDFKRAWLSEEMGAVRKLALKEAQSAFLETSP